MILVRWEPLSSRRTETRPGTNVPALTHKRARRRHVSNTLERLTAMVSEPVANATDEVPMGVGTLRVRNNTHNIELRAVGDNDAYRYYKTGNFITPSHALMLAALLVDAVKAIRAGQRG
jgi:hypothetical protein